ncbi:MAG TPA: glycosyl hydrolase family 8, partial [Pseudomonadales bacterium]|nr:glycosyl hydrolase family 8 [Pseudomonadales bacterium]
MLASSLSHARTTNEKLNDLDALWNLYSYTYIQGGRVIARDENGITTSEGQSYAMLRAVWSGDRAMFNEVWQWTQQNLTRPDNLFSWKWKDKILDANAATDADTDIAMALLLASERFAEEGYKAQALKIIDSIWEHEVVQWGTRYYITGGNWAPSEAYPTIHVGYLAPYAYQLFAEVDSKHPWEELIKSSYAILEWIYFDEGLALPPETIYLNKKNGLFRLNKPGEKPTAKFSYDVFPIFWRVATDQQWFRRGKTELRQRMLNFFELEWTKQQKFLDNYSVQGQPQSSFEGLPLYATVFALARVNESPIAAPLEEKHILPLWDNALVDKNTPYYLHNWLWFDRALEVQRARTFKEFLAFLYPFDFVAFNQYFPAVELGAFLLLCVLFRFSPAFLKPLFKTGALGLGIYLCGRYLWWRCQHSLNYIEPSGPYISIALLIAEIYCFITVILLLVQVGLRSPGARKKIEVDDSYQPSVDILVPIYSESLEILEATLMGCAMMNYRNKNIYVCDDSHRDSVKEMAEKFGGHYIRGPKKHAKAGNINNALKNTNGELILIFDTDHIPVVTFLDETVPLLADEKVGFVQTAHHFYNPDIFQNALRTPASISDEQDFFHHGIQPGRDNW